MLLAQASPYPMDRSLIDRILDDGLNGVDVSTDTNRRDEVIERAATLPIFKNLIDSVEPAAWDRFLEEEIAENFVPTIWDEALPELDKQLHKLLLIKLFRLDRFVPAAEHFVCAVFGSQLLDTP